MRWFRRVACSALSAFAALVLGFPFRSAAEAPLSPTIEAFSQVMRAWMAEHGVSRASLAVMRNDRLVLAVGYGGRRPDERVDIWSLSKAITGVCIATLVRDGKVHLDDPIGPLISPSYARFGRPSDERLERITIAELLSHRGGFPQVVGGNGFAPGLPALLRERPPRDATADMLMPQIMTLRLASPPATEYHYSNVGYLLLGQVIEAATGEGYAEACARRVLASAGVKNPALDRTWGRLLQSAGGWSLSGPEYLAFMRLLQPREPDMLPPVMRKWLETGDGKWIDARRIVAYTLGIFVRMIPGSRPNLFHAGDWTWHQNDAAGGPIDERRGTWAVLAGDATAWFASFDGVSSYLDPQKINELDAALWRARNAVASWPDTDDFPAMGVGALSIPR